MIFEMLHNALQLTEVNEKPDLLIIASVLTCWLIMRDEYKEAPREAARTGAAWMQRIEGSSESQKILI